MPPRAPASLLELDDGCLTRVVANLGVDRRTIMMVCRRLRDLAANAVHTHQQPGQSVMDAIEMAQPGDTVHLRPGYYKEALLLKKPLHLTCDDGHARILSPARFAIMCNAAGCRLEHLVLKSHQIDENLFYLVEMGPACHFVQMRHCEVLQGSFIGIQDLHGDDVRMVLERCQLHVGISLMAGRLDLLDCTIKCSSDSLWAYPGTTLVMRRCEFIDISDLIFIESSTAVVENCHVWAYDRGPMCVTDTRLLPDEIVDDAERVEELNRRILYLGEELTPEVWISLPARIRAVGRAASEEQAAAVLRGELVEGHVVMWHNTHFESRSNANITAQQEEVRREARQLMQEMQQAADAQHGLDPLTDEEDYSIGNSVDNPQEDEEWHEGGEGSDWSASDLDEDGLPLPAFLAGGEGEIVDLLSSDEEELPGWASDSSGSDGGSEGGGQGASLSDGGTSSGSDDGGGSGGSRGGSDSEGGSTSSGNSSG